MKTGRILGAAVAVATLAAGCGEAGREVDDGPDFSDSLLQIVPPALVSGGLPPEKSLLLTWDDDESVDFYRFFVNPDGSSGFTQFGDDIPADKPDGYVVQFPVAIHLFNWANALFMLEACVFDPDFPADPANATCTQVALQSPRLASAINVGVFSTPSPFNLLDAAYGFSIAISSDGLTLAVGAPTSSIKTCTEVFEVFEPDLPREGACEWIKENEDDLPPPPQSLEDYSDFRDIDEDGEITAADRPINSGAVFIYSRAIGTWSLQSIVYAPVRDVNDNFGWKIALNDAGTRLAVTALGEDSADGDPENNDGVSSGAVYIFDRVGDDWVIDRFLKADNPDDGDFFGWDLAFSGTGDVLAIAAPLESSDGTDPQNNDVSCSGAVYVYERVGGIWEPGGFLKAPAPLRNDIFGQAISLDDSGTRLAVGAPQQVDDTGPAPFFSCDASATPAGNTGFAYVYERSGSDWIATAELLASNAEPNDRFGYAIDINSNAGGDGIGTRVLVGAPYESGGATGVNGPQGNDSLLLNSGAAYLFEQSGGAGDWTQTQYIKASNTGASDQFGRSVVINDAGTALAVGAPGEAGIVPPEPAVVVINGPQEFDRAPGSGAAYVFLEESGSLTWSQIAYVKPSVLRSGINFGTDMAFAQGESTLAISAPLIGPGGPGRVFLY